MPLARARWALTALTVRLDICRQVRAGQTLLKAVLECSAKVARLIIRANRPADRLERVLLGVRGGFVLVLAEVAGERRQHPLVTEKLERTCTRTIGTACT